MSSGSAKHPMHPSGHDATKQRFANPELQPDELTQSLAAYTLSEGVGGDLAYETARHTLMDALGCAVLALRYPECTKLLGPLVPGTVVPGGARVPGTRFTLDPVRAAFNLGAMIRWLDYNDTFLAAEWGHPSDNIGAILAISDFVSRQGSRTIAMRQVLEAIIKAHEIQGVLSLSNSLNRRGLDHVLFVKVASAAVAAGLLGGSKDDVVNAVSHAWIDNSSLRVYRHAPNAGSRKSWAAGDATSRGAWFADLAMRGEMGYPTALTAERWGFEDVQFGGRHLTLERPLSSYVIENVLFKVMFPAEFHAQTAVEAAVKLHPQVVQRLDEAESVVLTTQEPALRIIDKSGPLNNPAARDHCLQYMVAIGLLFGDLTADHYGDVVAADPRIDALRSKMAVFEDPRYSADYLDDKKRSIANAVQVIFRSGERTEKLEVEYPIGHRRRRAEAIPLLKNKFVRNLSTRFSEPRVQRIVDVFSSVETLEQMPANEFMDLWVV